MDVYVPEGAAGTAPIVLFVHGGRFVRGDKADPDAAGIGPYFAKPGIVAISMNYRFAPENTRPSGAEDIGLALDWIASNAELHHGDPSKIILIGISAGAMHVADYTFREELQHADDGVIGAVLISPPTVDLPARPINPQRDALYYGENSDRADQSVVNHLDGRKLPVMVAYAEFEPEIIAEQTRILIDALAKRDGRLPLVVGVPGHNHNFHRRDIGTADESLSQDILGFVELLQMRNWCRVFFRPVGTDSEFAITDLLP